MKRLNVRAQAEVFEKEKNIHETYLFKASVARIALICDLI